MLRWKKKPCWRRKLRCLGIKRVIVNTLKHSKPQNISQYSNNFCHDCRYVQTGWLQTGWLHFETLLSQTSRCFAVFKQFVIMIVDMSKCRYCSNSQYGAWMWVNCYKSCSSQQCGAVSSSSSPSSWTSTTSWTPVTSTSTTSWTWLQLCNLPNHPCPWHQIFIIMSSPSEASKWWRSTFACDQQISVLVWLFRFFVCVLFLQPSSWQVPIGLLCKLCVLAFPWS